MEIYIMLNNGMVRGPLQTSSPFLLDEVLQPQEAHDRETGEDDSQYHYIREPERLKDMSG
jgi:hypothetical protein